MEQLHFLSLTHIFVLLFPVTGSLMTYHDLQDRVRLLRQDSQPSELGSAQFGHLSAFLPSTTILCSWGSGLYWDISSAVLPAQGPESFLLLLPCQDLPFPRSLSLCSFPQGTLAVLNPSDSYGLACTWGPEVTR